MPIFELISIGLLCLFLMSDTELNQKYLFVLILAGAVGLSLLTNMFFFSFICRDLCSD